MMKKISLIIIFLTLMIYVRGQDDNLTFQFSQILFSDMVDTIEKKVPVKIYYSDKWVDSLYLNVNAENSTVDGVLDNVLRREGLLFIITDDDKIILSKGYAIKTGFGKEYSEYIRRNYAAAATDDFVRPVAKTEDQSISDEYKIFKIGRPSATKSQERVTFSGVVRDAADGSVIPSVVVYVDKLKSGA